MKKLISLIVILGILAFGGAGFFLFSFLGSPAQKEDKKIIFTVQPGPFGVIAQKLGAEGVVSNVKLFTLYARLTNKVSQVKIGEYELSTSMKPGEVLAVLVSGKSIAYPVTIPEGYNIDEIADIFAARGFIKKAEFLALCKDASFIKELLGEPLPTLEGYLFPNTYMFTKFTGVKEIIREMVRQFLLAYNEVSAGEKLVHMSRHDAVTLASIIEKETGVPEERGLVSSVFHNRMKKGMMLQTDPTVLYGIYDKTGVLPKNIRKTDLITPTRYNTYTFRGLPFGPIANPGKESLYSAFNPEESEFLYFVSKNDGTHTFSSTYQDHNNAVKKFQLDRKARQGKSWRDYSKKKKAQ